MGIVALWVVQVLLAAAFLGSGATKLSRPREKLVKNMGWVEDFSQPTVRIIGVLEVLGAIGIVLPALTGILPWLTPLAALGLVLTMIGAALTHLRRAEYVPPLRYVGADKKRRAWQEAFAAYTGPFSYEVHELNVTAHGELAFVHSLNHVNATLASGHVADFWLRWTACFRLIDGTWLVVHDHVSVPADLEHGHAVLNLTP